MKLPLLILIVLAALFVYFYARKKGYLSSTAYLWLLASLFFPVIVIPIYFILNIKKSLSNASGEAAAVNEPDDFCPKCGDGISKNDQTCSKCGNQLNI